jgi:hypothetical protein
VLPFRPDTVDQGWPGNFGGVDKASGEVGLYASRLNVGFSPKRTKSGSFFGPEYVSSVPALPATCLRSLFEIYPVDRPVGCKEHLGGLLRYYYLEAA